MTERYLTEIPDEAKNYNIKKSPLGRLGTPSDIACVVAYLASDKAAWITGQIIAASGGAT